MVSPQANLGLLTANLGGLRVVRLLWWQLVFPRVSVVRGLGGSCKALYELAQKSQNITSIAFC